MTGQESSPLAIGNQSVRRLQITASRLVTTIFAGEYRSAFRGRGIEFDEVREYQAGDDVRSIDWNVTARQGRPFIKRFVEERELTLIMLLDRSPSMAFGTIRSTKLQVATEACALLSFAALRSHDRIALLTFGDGELRYLPPGKGKRQTLRLISDAMTPASGGEHESGFVAAIDHLRRVAKGSALICIFSDFIDPAPVRELAAVAARHDVVAVSVSDPAEHELPAAGLLRVIDPETGLYSMIDSGSPSVRHNYRQMAAGRRAHRKDCIVSSGADFLELGTRISPLHPLMQFFSRRKR
ncbi:MAG: DUF58 domain-containing protein [Pedobacter sp.]